jgi:hypothetical protein
LECHKKSLWVRERKETYYHHELRVSRISQWEGDRCTVAIKGFVHDEPDLDIVGERRSTGRDDQSTVGRLPVRAGDRNGQIFTLLWSVLKSPCVGSSEVRKSEESEG